MESGRGFSFVTIGKLWYNEKKFVRMMVLSKQRVLYFDLLRIAAAFFVVVLHTATSQFGSVASGSYEWNIFNLYDGMVRWTVPMFIMLSGALFLSRPIPVEKLYGKYILRIVIAFVVWSVLYVAEYQWCNGDLYPLNRSGIILHLMRGHYHLWYLIMLVGLYAMVPLLEPVVRSERLTRYFLVLTFVLSILLPTVMAAMKYISPDIHAAMGEIKPLFGISFGYLFYFVLGYWLSERRLSLWRVPIYVLGVAGFAATVWLSKYLTARMGHNDFTFFEYTYLNVMLETVLVFCVFRDLFGRLSVDGVTERLIGIASKCSFGVYLLHPFVLDLLDKNFALNTLSFDTAKAMPVVAVVVFVVSYCMSYILNKLPIIKKYLV